MAQKTRLLVVIGVSDDRKARAARFDLAHEAAARKAAGLMNYRVGIPKSEQGILLASKLPEGKLFESGLQDPDVDGLTSEQVSTIRSADAIDRKSVV